MVARQASVQDYSLDELTKKVADVQGPPRQVEIRSQDHATDCGEGIDGRDGEMAPVPMSWMPGPARLGSGAG